MHKKNDNTEMDSCKPKELESCGCGCSEPVENHINHHIEESEDHHDCDCGEDAVKENEEKQDTCQIEDSCGCSGNKKEQELTCGNGEEEDSCGCGCNGDSTSEKGHDTCETESANYSCSCGCSEGLLEEKESLWNRKNLFIIISSGILLPIGLYLDYFTGQGLLSGILFLAVIALSGHELIKKGIMGLLKGNFNMNFLMTIAVLGSFAIGSGAEGAVIIFLFYIAEFLEYYAGNRARKSIGSLLKLAPDTATVKRNNKNVELRANDVNWMIFSL